MTNQLPALESTIEMSLCGCQKSNWNSQPCVCKKNDLVCTEVCGCIVSKNELTQYIIESIREMINHPLLVF